MDRTRRPGAGDADAEELRPLLSDTAPTPICGHCLLRLSGKQILVSLWILFLYQLFDTRRFEAWGQYAAVFLLADVAYVSCAALCLLFFALFLAAVRPTNPCSFACYALFLGAALSLSWYSVVQIAFMHDLEVICMHPEYCPSREGEPTLLRFLSYCSLFPVGIARAMGGVLWRPWGFFAFDLPVAIASGEVHAMKMVWWQTRQIVIGTVFWGCIFLQVTAWVVIEAERWVHLMLALGTCMATTLAFYATAHPVMWFWWFLAEPWLKAWAGRRDFRAEEIATVFLMLWWALRGLYVMIHGEAERWNAKRNMEEALSYALAHPFRAELEQGFADLERGDGEGATQPSLARHLSRLGSSILAQGDAAKEEAPASSSLKEKRKTLISARRGMLRHQAGGAVSLPGSLCLKIRRKQILEDTWGALYDRPVSELLAPTMTVSFEGEKGIDMGGPTREWFDFVALRLAEGASDVRGSSLLATAPDRTLIPRPIAGPTEEVSQGKKERYSELMALGKFIALAIYRDRPLPLSFSLIACKHFLEVPVGLDDVRRLDPDFFRLRVAQVMKRGGLTEMQEALGEPLYFLSAPTELRPEPAELKPGGAQIIVTEENKAEYVQLLCEAYLCGDIRRELQCLLQGFWLLFPRELLRQCKVTPRDLSVMISGIANLDPEEWRKHCERQGGGQVHEWFWQFVQQLDAERRCMLLQFTTGSSRLPPGGFAELEPRFNISISEADSDEHLPHAHTCVNQLVLPKYSCYERLRDKLTLAISTEGIGFQFA